MAIQPKRMRKRLELAVATSMLAGEIQPTVCAMCKGRGHMAGAFAGFRRCRACSGQGLVGMGVKTEQMMNEAFGRKVL